MSSGFLLSTGADGKTGLHRACINKDIVTVSACIAVCYEDHRYAMYYKSQFYAMDDQRQTALHRAILSRDVGVCALVLGAWSNEQLYAPNKCYLYSACRSSTAAIVNLLVGRYDEKKLSQTCGDGRTALHYVCRQGKIDMLKVLLRVWPTNELYAKDATGRTALLDLCLWTREHLRVLFTRWDRTRLYDADSSGMTALHEACRWADQDMVEELLSLWNEDLYQKDDSGRTILILSCRRNDSNPSVSRAILEAWTTSEHTAYGAVDQEYGQTALHIACDRQWPEIARMICQRMTVNQRSIRDKKNRLACDLISEGMRNQVFSDE